VPSRGRPGAALCLGAGVHDRGHRIVTLEGAVLDVESRRMTLLVISADAAGPEAVTVIPAAAVEWAGPPRASAGRGAPSRTQGRAGGAAP
jgi:hypothetical protein